MNWRRVREVVAFLGVAGSLLFVGLEIRQNTAATRGQTRQELAALNQDWLALLAADSAFSELYFRAWEERGEVAPHEQRRVEFMMVMELRRLENVFFQYREGLVDQSALGSYGLQALDMEQPRFQQWWIDRGWRDAFDPEFVSFLEDPSRRAP